MLPFDLKHLSYALAAAEHGSFRRAADTLGVRQSELSWRVRQLEDRIGFAVFERSSSGVRPTPAGATFLRDSRNLLDSATLMAKTARDVARGQAGWLALGFHNVSITGGPLRKILADFRRTTPQVALRSVEDAPKRLLANIEGGSLDMAILSGPIPRRVDALALWSEGLAVALPADHSLAAQDSVRCDDLRGERFLVSYRYPSPETACLVMTRLTSPGAFPNTVNNAVGHHQILAMVGLGYGLALVPQSGTNIGIEGVTYRPLSDGPIFDYKAVWRNDTENAALLTFLDLLQRHAWASDELSGFSHLS